MGVKMHTLQDLPPRLLLCPCTHTHPQQQTCRVGKIIYLHLHLHSNRHRSNTHTLFMLSLCSTHTQGHCMGERDWECPSQAIQCIHSTRTHAILLITQHPHWLIPMPLRMHNRRRRRRNNQNKKHKITLNAANALMTQRGFRHFASGGLYSTHRLDKSLYTSTHSTHSTHTHTETLLHTQRTAQTLPTKATLTLSAHARAAHTARTETHVHSLSAHLHASACAWHSHGSRTCCAAHLR